MESVDGGLPYELRNLSNLAELDLLDNQLGGKITSALGDLSNPRQSSKGTPAGLERTDQPERVKYVFQVCVVFGGVATPGRNDE